jgi:formylmethanofuran dehydrogenase subunit C
MALGLLGESVVFSMFIDRIADFMPLTLSWKGSIGRAIDGERLRPDLLIGPAVEMARSSIPAGNGTIELGDLFAIEGDGSDGLLIFEGDLRTIGGLASGMSSGQVEIRGDVGPRLGSRMTGGSILVEGSAGDRAGAEMLGGLIRIKQNAGDDLGSALPGSRLGMRDGVILVDGDVGNDAGLLMRRGLIAVNGRIGDDAGHAMVAGSIFGFGPVGKRAGQGMKRGSLVFFGLNDFEPSPTFEPSGTFRPHTLNLYLGHLQSLGFKVPRTAFTSTIRRYNGDRLEHGRGEILVAD